MTVPQKRKTWRSAVPGLIVIAVLLAIVTFTLTYARLGALRGATYTVYLPVDEARNVMTGTDVWLAGLPVGEVAAIHFRPAEVDPESRLLLELRILTRYRDLIRVDSEADIRSGGTLLGAPVISIGIGTERAAVVMERDTLRRATQRELRDAMVELAALGGEFSMIAENVRTMRERTTGLGTAVGGIDRDRQRVMRLLTDPEIRDPFPRRPGSLRLLIEDQQFGDRVGRIVAGFESVATAMQTPSGTTGRLAHEEQLQGRLAALAAELDSLNTQLRLGEGTVGRLAYDRALFDGIERLRLELELLRTDFSRWPERYLRF